MTNSEILGYQISKDRRIVTHFRSSCLELAEKAKSELFYLDGIKRLYCSSTAGADEKDVQLISVKVTERFRYKYDGSVVLKRPRLQLGGGGASISYEGMFKTMMCDEAIFVSQLMQQRQSKGDVSTISSLLQEVCIDLNYPEQSPETIMDNVNFTSLTPSKLPLHAWSVRTYFNAPVLGSDFGGSGGVGSTGTGSSLSLSRGIRRLLGMYIFGKSLPAGSTMAALTCTEETMQAATQKATTIASVLSQGSRRAVWKLCRSRRPDGEEMDEEKEKLRSKLVSHLFENRFASALPLVSCDFELPGAPPLGSWLSMCALFAGSACIGEDVSALSLFWSSCVGGLRNSWDHSEETLVHAIQSHRPSQAVFCEEQGGSCSVEERLPLWQRMLWDDVIQENALRGVFISHPDRTRSLAVQKLQSLQFACAVKNDASLCPPPASYQGSDTPELLLRRLPLTEDGLAQQLFIAAKIKTGSTPNHQVKIKVSYPALLSDMRSYKAKNPGSSVENFCAWSGSTHDVLSSLFALENGRADLALSEIWEQCECCHAVMQKPLYRAESEAEKCIDFFDSLSPAQFASEMLITLMSAVYTVMRVDASEWECQNCGGEEGVLDSAQADFQNELAVVEQNITDAIRLIRQDTSQYGVDDAEASISQAALLAVDECCEMLDRIDNFCSRAREMDAFLSVSTLNEGASIEREHHRRLCVALSRERHNLVVADTQPQVRCLFELCKHLSSDGQQQHSWQRHNNREIGTPSHKTFSLFTCHGEQATARIDGFNLRFSSKKFAID